MAANKTQQTEASVDTFVAGIAPERQADVQALIAMMERASGEPPKMWGSAIIGFGNHHYRYESGREGDICRIGFSPRKSQFVLYLACDLDKHQAKLARLGKHSRGKGCLNIKKVADVDMSELEALARYAYENRAVH